MLRKRCKNRLFFITAKHIIIFIRMDIYEPQYQLTYDSPCGILMIHSNGKGVVKIERIYEYDKTTDKPDSLCEQAKQELVEYFDGVRTIFEVAIDLTSGTPFQQGVWDQLCKIPFGKTKSYGALANALENPKAVRAVGTANGKNPILIIVPCHRVIGADGSLTGFSAGIDIKKCLLSLEQGKTVGSQICLF